MSESTELKLYVGQPPAVHAAQRFLALQTGALARRLTPYGIDPERYKALMLTEMMRTPTLLQCMDTEKGQASLQLAIFEAAQVGLEPLPQLGHVYLVPRYNKRDRYMQACCDFGYKGLVQLILRSPRARSVQAHPVYPEDEFDFQYGTRRPGITHRPRYEGPPSFAHLTHVYATCQIRNGGTEFVVLNRAEIAYYRAKSQRPDSGPWADDGDGVAMALKTAIRRLHPSCPMGILERNAIIQEERREQELDDAEPEQPARPALVSGGRDRRRGAPAAPDEPPPLPPDEPATAADPPGPQPAGPMPGPQRLAMLCRQQGIDHHALVQALTDKQRGHELTDHELQECISVAQQIAAGRMRFQFVGDAMRVVAIEAHDAP